MKLTYDGYKDHKYIRALTHSWLASRKGEIMSGMKARILFNQIYGIDIDHHEYAYTLDWMSQIEECVHHSYHGGDTEYLIK